MVFPSLRKFIKHEARLLTSAEYHQMAGRAGRPQFDDKGLAITLAPEQITSDLKKELKDAAKRPAPQRRVPGLNPRRDGGSPWPLIPSQLLASALAVHGLGR